ncbi:MAG: lamin tail domain-containing protein [Bacteroidota bacterium]
MRNLFALVTILLAAASAHPVHAQAPGEVVINEFMADNDTIPDPAGERDDWIEFTNNTTTALALDSMCLTDNPAVPAKWRFPPGTSIPAEGYLIVWADNDSGQAGLHANFALSAGGESIWFSRPDGTILDSVTFGPQTTNRSLARIPNGTGAFLRAMPTFGFSNNGSVILDPVLTPVLLPQYIEGVNGTNANRIPFAFRARISGLLPTATYRFTNQIVTSADAGSTNGAGNCIFATSSGDFVRTTGPSIATPGAHGTFVTDASGAHEGWFISEPTGNARFIPGRHIFVRIALNDGGSGTTIAVRLTTADSVRVVKLDAGPGDSTGTGLRCQSMAAPKDFVIAYDNTAGTGRPVSATFVENDGTANTTANNYAAFYSASVDGTDGAFGLVLPNILPTGIRRFERRSLGTGALAAVATDEDGIWPSGATTVNPSGGVSEIILTGGDVSLVTGLGESEPLPSACFLGQNYPNPFNPLTTIPFSVSREGRVTVRVYDGLGRCVATPVDGPHSPGTYSAAFDAAGLSSGVYLYVLEAKGIREARRLVVLK